MTTSFSARLVRGSGRGKEIGTPTLNIDLNDVPTDIAEGIYAGWVKIDQRWCKAAIHYGPRPVFQDSRSFEVHVLDAGIEIPPERIDIVLVERLRDVQDFPSPEALSAQIGDDVRRTRAILDTHGAPDS
jgi:riboflavin kinase / FMN adenylyltransferase